MLAVLTTPRAIGCFRFGGSGKFALVVFVNSALSDGFASCSFLIVRMYVVFLSHGPYLLCWLVKRDDNGLKGQARFSFAQTDLATCQVEKVL
jgi:hypothetical protein